MRIIYNIGFLFFFCLSAPYYFLKMWRRGNWKEGFSQRFGRYSSKIKQAVTNRHVLWLHAVSVGEVNVATQLIRALEPRLPNLKIVVSTTTSTGMGELQRLLPSHIQKVYYPIDRAGYVRRALISLHPQAIVLVEAEIWPNFLWVARDLGISTFLVNARLSERSYRGYRRWGILFRPIFRAFSGVGCQNEADAERLRELGCKPDAVRVVGSLKYDAAKIEERRMLDIPKMLAQLGVPPGSPILIGGSTHAGEEAILADAFLRLRLRHPELFLILVPRHFERGKEVGRELEARGIRFAYRKDVMASSQFKPNSLDCLLVNTTGELKYFYECATIIFVGKSLTAEGGQNPIEPGSMAKPMIFGPNMQNFAQIARSFLERQGALEVSSPAELEAALEGLLENRARAVEIGRNALAVVRENLGAIERTVDMIIEQLSDGEMYVAPKSSL